MNATSQAQGELRRATMKWVCGTYWRRQTRRMGRLRPHTALTPAAALEHGIPPALRQQGNQSQVAQQTAVLPEGGSDIATGTVNEVVAVLIIAAADLLTLHHPWSRAAA